MDCFPGNWGNPSQNSDLDFSYRGPSKTNNNYSSDSPITRTQQPIVTGTSVLGIRYKDGVILASDTLASYGSLARFFKTERLFEVGKNCVVGASGDISDFQALKHTLDSLLVSELCYDDGHELQAKHIHEYLSNLFYGRRNKQNPLWNSVVVAGVDPVSEEKFLGYVDLQGTTYTSDCIATGFGSYLAIPLLRKHLENDREKTLTKEEAIHILQESLRVLYYRDARSLDRVQHAIVTKDGVEISEPYKISSNWEVADMIQGYGA